MSENIEDLSIQWVEEDGTVSVKEIDKFVLSKGSWTTIMFLYQDRDRRSGEYSPAKVRIVRYQKRSAATCPRANSTFPAENRHVRSSRSSPNGMRIRTLTQIQRTTEGRAISHSSISRYSAVQYT